MNSDIISGTAKYPEYLKFNTQFTRSEEIEPDVYRSKQLPLTNRVEEVATPEASLIVIDGELHPIDKGAPPDAVFLTSASRLLHVRDE